MRRACLALLLAACSEGERPEALLSVSVASLDFGQVPIGRNHTRRLAVGNEGPLALSITKVKLESGAFEVSPSMLTVGAGERTELRVRFVPESAGPFAATLSFESNDARGSTAAVALSGVGACGGLGCPPPSSDGGVEDAAESPADAGVEDTGAANDAEIADAGATPDAEPIDVGVDAGIAGLAAYYRFEDVSGALIDDSGNQNDGVPSTAGLTRGVAGRVGSAVQFEGSVGQFVVPASATLDGASAISIELWINTHALMSGLNQTILARGLNTGGDGLFLLTQCNNLYVAFSRSGVTGLASATTNCDSFLADTWVHVAMVNDGLFLSVYLDGQKVAESMGGFLGPIGAPLYLGRKEPGVDPFVGLIDELSWWTIARTDAEICVDAGGTFSAGSCTVP